MSTLIMFNMVLSALSLITYQSQLYVFDVNSVYCFVISNIYVDIKVYKVYKGLWTEEDISSI